MAAVTKAAVLSGAAVPKTPYWQLAAAAIDDSVAAARGLLAGHRRSERIAEGRTRARIAGELPT